MIETPTQPTDAAAPTAGSRLCLDERLLVASGLVAIGLAVALAALIGLPLFEDGSWYYFKIAVDGVGLAPNLRYAALIPQLPALALQWVGADALMIRHAFAFSYAALPMLSLTACWLLLRRRMPALILLPLLGFLLNLINLSAVSELLSSLYLSWPLVVAMAVAAQRPWVQGYALLAAPLLLLLHPLAFLPAAGLALLALVIARLQPAIAVTWTRLAGWLALSALLRLLWTLFAANAYERGRATAEQAPGYLFTETLGQHLLLALVSAAALGLGWCFWRAFDRAAWPLPAWLRWIIGLLPLAALLVAAEMLLGEGIKLKAAITFAVALVLMALTAAVALRCRQIARQGPLTRGYAGAASLVLLAMLLISVAKSAAWWSAAAALKNAVAEPGTACLDFGAERPFALQWPWMAIVDSWATPMTALALRPQLRLSTGVEPIALLLPNAGCQLLHATGQVQITSWIVRPFDRLEQRFGPLHRP